MTMMLKDLPPETPLPTWGRTPETKKKKKKNKETKRKEKNEKTPARVSRKSFFKHRRMKTSMLDRWEDVVCMESGGW